MGEDIRNDGPKSHLKKIGTPTMGGLVFLVTVSFITLVFNRSRTQTLFPILVTAMAGLFGVMEDLSKVYRKSKLSGAIKGSISSNIFSKVSYSLLCKLGLRRIWLSFKEFAQKDKRLMGKFMTLICILSMQKA